MSRTQTKQTSQTRPAPLWYWIALAGVALVGVILIAYSAMRPVNVVGKTAEGDYFQGNPNAQVTIYAWGNFGCGPCGAHVKYTLPLLRERYIATGKVKYIYRSIIWNVDEQNQVLAAQSPYCAGDQDKFWEMHDWMYTNVDRWGQDPDIMGALFATAVPEVGLDEAAFRTCLETAKYRDHVVDLTNNAMAREITLTPSYMIGDQLVQGFLDLYDFRVILEDDSGISPGFQLLLAIGLPAVLGLFLISTTGPQVGPRTIRLRMIVGGLALPGILVSLYLALYQLNISGNLACLLGNGCIEVNRSEYVGMLGPPIALIGVLGYGLILAIVLSRLAHRQLWGGLTGVLLIGLGGIGFALSLFLTLLEVLVLQQFCSWCLVSTLLITGILGVSIAAFVTEQREPR